jgi:hypothetical protein
MLHYSFVRLADGEIIPLPADNDAMALARLGHCERGKFSLIGEGSPEYLFAKSEAHTFWCRPHVPVYRA